MEQHTRRLAVGCAAVVGGVDAPAPGIPHASAGGTVALGMEPSGTEDGQVVSGITGSSSGARAERDPLRLRALALGVPYLHLPPLLPVDCLRLMDVALAQHLRAVPVGRSATALTVAFDTRWDARALFRLRAATGLDIFPVLTLARELECALAQLVG